MVQVALTACFLSVAWVVVVDGQGACRPTRSDDQGPYYKANSPLRSFENGAPLPSLCTNSDVNDRLILNGTIRMASSENSCGSPVRAMIDIWQADPSGVYSDISPSSPDFSCRTRIITDANGFFTFSSVMPGRYGNTGPGRYPGGPRRDMSGQQGGQSQGGRQRQARQMSGQQGGPPPGGPGLRPAHVHFKVTPLDSSATQMIGNTLTTQVYFAMDKYLQPNDMCPVCNSGDPTLTIDVRHETDIKTYSGSWDVLLQP